MDDSVDVVAVAGTLGAKLDSLGLTDAEAGLLHQLLSPVDDEVAGYGMGGFSTRIGALAFNRLEFSASGTGNVISPGSEATVADGSPITFKATAPTRPTGHIATTADGNPQI